jgi:alginate O-acetyltransferase complex protein AlgI
VTIFAVVVTMALIGLWHGASWNFLFFGLYHGVGLAVLQTRIFSLKYYEMMPKWIRYGIGMAATFIFVTLGWPFFVTASLHDSLLLYQKIFGIFI